MKKTNKTWLLATLNLAVLGALPLQANQAVYLKNSATQLSLLLADRMACLENRDSKDTLQENLLQGITLNSLKNDFLETCGVKLDSANDLALYKTLKLNSALAETIKKDIETQFVNRFEARSGLNASDKIKNYAKVLAKAIVDIRYHGRRMYRHGWTCKSNDSTVAAIHSRLNNPTKELKAARANETLGANNTCESFNQSEVNPWTDHAYADDGSLSNVISLNVNATAIAGDDTAVVPPPVVDVPAVPAPTNPGALDTAPSILQLVSGRESRSKNLNGVYENTVVWNECGGSKGSLRGNYTEQYEANSSSATWSSSKVSGCGNRKISKAFAEFLSKNLGRCAAMGTLPEAHTEVSAALKKVRKTDAGAVDNAISGAVKRVNTSHANKVNQIANNIASIEILHQGIQGDSNHKSTSYHSAAVLRAIDLSHIRIKYKDGTSKVYQHGVASFAENANRNNKFSSLNAEQQTQHKFWTTFGACLTEKDGGIISKSLHHTKIGLAHAGHVHISLPYANRGRYNSKHEDSFHESNLVLE